MPAADAIITAVGCLLLLAHFAVSRRKKQLKVVAE
jgi:hypothetical protein